MQNFGKNVSKMQHYGSGVHLYGHMTMVENSRTRSYERWRKPLIFS